MDLICHLERWTDKGAYERVGLERDREELLGVLLPSLRLPSRPGASMATIVEVAARDHRRRLQGENAVARLDERVRREMGRA